jgi:hypothetical protein
MNVLKGLRAAVAGACLLGVALVLPVSAQPRWNRYGPGTRTQAGSFYDPVNNQFIIFAGQHAPTNIDFNDVWALYNAVPPSTAAFENLTWARVSVSSKAPAYRFGMASGYNPTSNLMLLFGGGTGFPGPCVNDLWTMTHANSLTNQQSWAKLTASGTLPGIREGASSAYDTVNNKFIMFGGYDCTSTYYSDLWILSNADGSTGTPSWSKITPAGTAPPARYNASAIYDSANNIMVVFGGETVNTNTFNDVWILTNANGIGGTPTWTQASPTGTKPAARAGQSAVYDAANNIMIVYGGITNRGVVLNEWWTLANANGKSGTPSWTQLVSPANAPPRKLHTAMYDPVSNEMIIFGGDSTLPATFSDDHVWILTQANGL